MSLEAQENGAEDLPADGVREIDRRAAQVPDEIEGPPGAVPVTACRRDPALPQRPGPGAIGIANGKSALGAFLPTSGCCF